ncbi:MAG: hypothetical protein JWP37_187 [Mucilaginibacter sp.]|nr:hypothetical protein [Mucilaginibacter sp.]
MGKYLQRFFIASTLASKLGFSLLILLLLTGKAFAATYDWVGGTSTNASTGSNWYNENTSSYGTVPGSSDDVYVDWNYSVTFFPVVTANTTWKSLTFGYGNTWVAYAHGYTATISLNVNSGITLTVSGNITQNHYLSATGSPDNYIITIIGGAGTILCQGNFLVGDAITQPAISVADVSQVSIQITQLTITGNVVMNSNGNNGIGGANGICYPWFSVEKGTTTLLKQVIFATNNSPVADSFDTYNPPATNYPGYGKFTADNTAGSTSTLELKYKQPIVPADKFYVYFTYGGNNGTVLYDDPTVENQTIYTANEPSFTTTTTYINTSAPSYYNLTLSGSSTKLVDKNSVLGATTQGLTIGNNWTTSGGAVNLNTNNPTVTITGNWTNSTNITQGSGNITVSNTLQNNSNTITLSAGNLTINNVLQINGGTIAAGGGTVTVSGAFQNNSGTLQCGSGSVIFNGNYTNSQTFTAGTGTVYFSGTSQALIDNGPTGTTFNNVTFNASGTATMSAGTGNFVVSGNGVLTMVSPAKLVAGTAGAAYLTLNSNASSSATIAPILGTSTITGNVNVKRYITGGIAANRGYRLLSSPVYGSVVSSNNVYSINYLKNSIFLTGTSTAGGFDNVSAANPTLYLYRENMTPLYTTFLNSNFKGINNITAPPTYSMDDASNPSINIPVGNGYLCFFRGNRASATFAAETAPSYVPQTVTLSASGTLNQGQITVKDWFTPLSANLSYTTASPATIKGYNLVGNPYASSIDWENFQTLTSTTGIYGTSIGAAIYVLDPASKNYGAYVKGGGGMGTNNASNIISSGQGFFVVTSCSCATLIFNEGAKTNTQVTAPKLLMGMPVNYTNNQYLRLQLAKDSISTDNLVIRFINNANTTYDSSVDAPYLQGYGAVSLSSFSSDHYSLAINVQPLPKTSESIDLLVHATADGNYTLNMKNTTGIPQLFDIWLMDHYKKDSLDMRHNTTYTFNLLEADTNSFGAHRFSLVIRQNPAFALHLLNFTAAKTTNGAQLAWVTENEQNYTNFTVERSTNNGATFDLVGSIASSGQGTYSFLDKNPLIATDLYRVKLEDLNGTVSYSNLIPLMYSNLNNNVAGNSISVYPNPAGSVINLAIIQNTAAAPNVNTASYAITITNSNGSIVKTATSSQPSLQQNVSSLMPGTYLIQVVNNKDKSDVGKSKFVKL